MVCLELSSKPNDQPPGKTECGCLSPRLPDASCFDGPAQYFHSTSFVKSITVPMPAYACKPSSIKARIQAGLMVMDHEGYLKAFSLHGSKKTIPISRSDRNRSSRAFPAGWIHSCGHPKNPGTTARGWDRAKHLKTK